MGSGMIDLTTLDLGRPTDICVVLQDINKPSAQLGEIFLTATLLPKTQEDKEQVSNCFFFFLERQESANTCVLFTLLNFFLIAFARSFIHITS